MTPDDAISKAIDGETVRYPTSLMDISRDRQDLLKAALRMCSFPIAIFTRTENGEPFFIVKRDTEPKTSIEEVRKENIRMGWERDEKAQRHES